MIHVGKCLFKIIVRLNHHNRTEDLLIAHLHARLGPGQDCGRYHRALPLAACDKLGSALHSLLHPRLNALRFALPDQRAHLGCLIGRIAGYELGRMFHDLP